MPILGDVEHDVVMVDCVFNVVVMVVVMFVGCVLCWLRKWMILGVFILFFLGTVFH